MRPQQGCDTSHTVDNMTCGTSINNGAADWVGFIVRSRDEEEGHDGLLSCLIATEQVAQCADCNQLLAAILSLCAVCQSEPTPSAMPDLTVSYPRQPLCSLRYDELPPVDNVDHDTQTWVNPLCCVCPTTHPRGTRCGLCRFLCSWWCPQREFSPFGDAALCHLLRAVAPSATYVGA